MAKDSGYKYTPLNALAESDSVFVYAVVESLDKHYIELQNRFVLDLKLTDPTLSCPSDDSAWKSNAVKCSIYSRNEEDLPNVKSRGDIIRIHRIKCNYQGGKGLTLHANASTRLSIHVWEETNGGNMQPRSPRANSFKLLDKDTEQITELRTWWHKLSNRDVDTNRLKDFVVNKYRNVVVRVVGIYKPRNKQDISIPVVLSVCDATKITNKQKDLACTRWTVSDDYGAPIVDQEFASQLDDYLYDVYIWDEHKLVAADLKPGQYVLLNNLHLHTQKSIIASNPTLTLHGGRKYDRCIKKLALEDVKVAKIQQDIATLLLKRRREKNAPAHSNPSVSAPELNPVSGIPPKTPTKESAVSENSPNIALSSKRISSTKKFNSPKNTDSPKGNCTPKNDSTPKSSSPDVTMSPTDNPKRIIRRAKKSISSVFSPANTSEADKKENEDTDATLKKTCYVKPALRNTHDEFGSSDESINNNSINEESINSDIIILHDSRNPGELENGNDNVTSEESVSLEELDNLFPNLNVGDKVGITGLKAEAFLPENNPCQMAFVTCRNCGAKSCYEQFRQDFENNGSVYLCMANQCKDKKTVAVFTLALYVFVLRYDKTDEYMISFSTAILENILEVPREIIAQNLRSDPDSVWSKVQQLAEKTWSIKAIVTEELGIQKALHVNEFAFD